MEHREQDGKNFNSALTTQSLYRYKKHTSVEDKWLYVCTYVRTYVCTYVRTYVCMFLLNYSCKEIQIGRNLFWFSKPYKHIFWTDYCLSLKIPTLFSLTLNNHQMGCMNLMLSVDTVRYCFPWRCCLVEVGVDTGCLSSWDAFSRKQPTVTPFKKLLC